MSEQQTTPVPALKVQDSTSTSDHEDMSYDAAEPSSTSSDQIFQQSSISAIFPPCGLHEFRLMELHSGRDMEPLHVTLRTYPLANSPMYSAVSHTWGDENSDGHLMSANWQAISPKQTKKEAQSFIILNGQEFSLNKLSLELMLRDLRDPAMSRVLWIDGLCINQDDIPERNAQVLNMAQIFSKADCVVIWLSGFTRLPIDDGRWSPSPPATLNTLLEMVGPNSLCPPEEYNHDLLVDIRRHRYWTRTWIIQEIILGRRVEIQSGEVCIPLELVVRVLKSNITKRAIQSSIDSEGPSLPEQLLTERAKRREGTPSTNFRTVLDKYSYSKSSDPRDKIFALLSLNTNAKQHIKVDYNMNVMDLLLQVMHFLARFDGVAPRDLITLGVSLRRQLRITRQEVCREIQIRAASSAEKDLLSGLHAVIYLRGYVDPSVGSQGETLVPSCRQMARPLASYSPMQFRDAKDVLHPELVLTSTQTADMKPPSVSTRDYYVFSVTKDATTSEGSIRDDPKTIGLAPMRLAKGHKVWQFAGTTVAFVGKSQDDGLHIFGRAYLASVGHVNKPCGFDNLSISPDRPLPQSIRFNRRRIRLTSSLLLELILWADDGD